MQPLILIVEDNDNILQNLQILLEFNNYRVVSAHNGLEGLAVLEELDELPEIILSDIIMPKMDGYTFFKVVSENPRYFHLPFIFVTARSEPEDIRLGKMLGVDDYITKPFKEDDLLSIIAGKLSRNKKVRVINNKLKELIEKIYHPISQLDVDVVLVTLWDEKLGPTFLCSYPPEETLEEFPVKMPQLSTQLYNSVSVIYGHDQILQAQGLLLKIENITKDAYIYFDSYPDPTLRSGEQIFMIALIADQINYLHSLKLRPTFKKIIKEFKELKECGNIAHYMNEIQKSLTEIN